MQKQMLARMRRKRITFAPLVEMQTGAAALENSMEAPQKTKNRTTLWPSNCTTRYLSKVYTCAVSKGHMHPKLYSSTSTIATVWKEPKCASMDKWIKKMWCIYTMGYYSVITNEILPFAAMWMELEGIMLSEISQRKTNIIWLHSYEDFKRQNRWT